MNPPASCSQFPRASKTKDKQRFCCREEGLCAEEEGESEYSDSEDGESEDGESAMLERETSDEDGESYDCEQLLYQDPFTLIIALRGLSSSPLNSA